MWQVLYYFQVNCILSCTAFIYTALLLAVITFLPGLPPDAKFLEYSITPPTKLSEKLDNNRINGIEFLHIGKFKGPESFDSYNGELYVGLQGGYVVKIDEKGIIPFVKFGGKCGIFKVDRSGNYQKIIDISKPIDNKIPRIPNSLDIAENGDIFWTDSSTDFPLYDAVYTMLINPSGRLFRYNAATKTNEVLLKNLGFSNGVKLSKDESFLIISETLTSRIIKYNLKGAKAGQQEILLEGLPGIPDNIHTDNHGGFLVSLYTYIDSENPQLMQILIPHPNLRKMIVRLFTLIEAPFKLIQNVYPNFYTERIIHAIGSFETLSFLTEPKSVILHLDSKGKLVDAAYLINEMNALSSAFIHKGYLWLGSPHSEYVARVPLKQVFPHLAQKEKLMHHSNIQDTKERPKTHSTTVKPQTVKTPTVQTLSTEKPITKTARSTETSTSIGTSPKTSTNQEKIATSKPSTTSVPSTTVKPSTASVPSTTSKQSTTSVPSTTSKPSTTSVPSTTSKPSTTSVPSTTVTTSTTVKPSTTSVPSTTVKPSIVSKTTPTQKATTGATKPTAKSNTETTSKSNNKEIKSETAKNKVISDVKSENIKEINSKSEINKRTVQNNQFKAQKQEHQNTESPNINNNNIPK
ncbi:adipocyte plasma membrane-associated protein-like isoform X2 [Vespa velutina]|uniref:adipocyte plasma membrane-associated protein-like isoform X2 n=1 Tax=Vespa velutina TaxID=202808 RepID=UPI001FB46A71|nr:adipocyte plasma membrane-associated protein-like isoform X2 [Vespa velutina]